MLDTSPPTSSPPVALSKALSLLGLLKASPTGEVILQHIEQLVTSYVGEREQIEAAYAQLLHQLINIYADRLQANPTAAAQLKLLQLRLMPPMSKEDLRHINTLIEQIRQHSADTACFSESEIEAALAPLLASFGHTLSPPKQSPQRELMEEITPDHLPEPNNTSATPQVEMKVNAAYRQHLQQHQVELSNLQSDFSRQVEQAFEQDQALTQHLERLLDELQVATDNSDLGSYRQRLTTQIQDFLSHHQTLSQQFGAIHSAVQDIDADNRKLQEELDKVRLLSLTDELTGLPNRRAFLRRLDEEIGRSQRYGSHLAVAIIDLDRFKAVNDTYGHPVGDMVLRVYTREVLSIFRHHDLVSRYGGEEFAVILPNTTEEGGLLALRKVQRRAGKIMCKINGQRFALPGFSAGLTEYRTGEKLTEFVARADAAMYQAKRQGGNAIEATGTPAAAELANH